MNKNDLLHQIELSDIDFWSFIFYGWERKWIETDEIISYAEFRFLEDDGDPIVSRVVEVQPANDELRDIICAGASRSCDEKMFDKCWAYVLLRELDRCEADEGLKLEALQIVFAELGYPKYLEGISIYSGSKIPPLQAMGTYLECMQQKLTKK